MTSGATAFNARNTPPKEVAETFILPDRFGEMAKFQGLVLVGPRGIGKTTIMKVLTASGLHYLSKKRNVSSLKVDYVPIYIPAETLWKGNARVIARTITNENDRNHILNGLFVDHCLHELLSSIEDSRKIGKFYPDKEHPYWVLKVSAEQEENICRQCSSFWQLEKIQTSFIGLKLALLTRMNLYTSAVNDLDTKIAYQRAISTPNLDVLIMLKGFFDIAEEILGIDRWSINFDEMEIAPKHVLSKLYENLRSFDQRAVLKFSLFPYIDFYTHSQRLEAAETGPVEGQDYIAIVLTNKFSNQDFSFAKEFVINECRKQGVPFDKFIEYLNDSKPIRATRSFKGDEFSRKYEQIYGNIKSRKADPSYIQYMEKNKFSSEEDITNATGGKRASVIRKTAPIAEIRYHYLSELKNSDQKTRRNSIKGYGYYHGYNQMLSLTEANPRAINFYVNDLIECYIARINPTTAQNRVIRRNVDRFRALVATQAIPTDPDANDATNALNVVDRLGDVLADSLFEDKFQTEPSLSYVFKDIDQSMQMVLGIAVNTGALIVDQEGHDKYLIFNLNGCRARISHRMSPFYPLPTITGKANIIRKIPDFKEDSQIDLLTWRGDND